MFLRFIRSASLVYGTWYTIVIDRMGVRRVRKTSICPPWKLALRTKYFCKNLKSASSFWLIDLILEITVFLPVWNSHCTRLRFTVTVSCSGELAVHSCPYRGGLRKSRADCSAVGLYCVTIPLQQSCRGSLYITVAGVLSHGAAARRRLGR